LASGSPIQIQYLGLEIDVPAGVFPPTPVSDLLGSAVQREVSPEDRVLDMGTGSGINAILAAKVAHEVIGVDINPHAVVTARRNAHANAVGDRTQFFESDVFESVSGAFDLIVFDPPFRWLKPRDMLERSMADEGYEALTRFMTQARDRFEARRTHSLVLRYERGSWISSPARGGAWILIDGGRSSQPGEGPHYGGVLDVSLGPVTGNVGAPRSNPGLNLTRKAGAGAIV
jgi:methylase of polypeptide subunit release factors